jgi:hypothetical protein
VWNLLHVTILAPSILRLLLDLGKICSVCSLVLVVILFCHKSKTVSEVCRHLCWIVLLEDGVCWQQVLNRSWVIG